MVTFANYNLANGSTTPISVGVLAQFTNVDTGVLSVTLDDADPANPWWQAGYALQVTVFAENKVNNCAAWF